MIGDTQYNALQGATVLDIDDRFDVVPEADERRLYSHYGLSYTAWKTPDTTAQTRLRRYDNLNR